MAIFKMLNLSTDLIFAMLLVSFLTETLVEILKNFFMRLKAPEEAIMLLSLILGVGLCVILQISLFLPSNIGAFWLGCVVCGVVASRGSNYVHNWFDRLPKK